MQQNNTINIRQNWRSVWNSALHRLLTIWGSVLLAIVLSILPYFFQNIEHRQGGIQLNDYILDALPSVNVSPFIFMIIWGFAALTMVRAVGKPIIYTKYIWLYSFVVISRMISISLVPLAAPARLVELVDPLTGIFYGHAVITKDLFYSGHVSTMVCMVLCLERKTEKWLAIAGTAIVGVLLLVQHVHYTIDVIAAPVIVFALFKLTQNLLFKPAPQD
ncbi:phosphatase PAP2-related protein [Mucilaginibacter sp.]